MKAKILTLAGALVALLLTLTSHAATASMHRGTTDDSNDTPVIGVVAGTSTTGHTVEWEKQQTADASTIAEEAGRGGADVILNGLTDGQTPTTIFSGQVTGDGPNELIKTTHRKKIQRELRDAIASARRGAPARGRVDVLSSIRHLADNLHALPHHPRTTEIVLFGSGLQNTPPLQLTDAATLADTKTTLEDLERQGMITDCRGWNVHMIGAVQTLDGPLDSLREVQLRELFRQLFQRCGGRLVEWSSDRLISFPGAGTEVATADWVKKRQVIVPLRAGVLFDGDSATLRPTARRDLDKPVAILTRTHATASAEVAGYAASVPGGSADKALALSWARARAVGKYLQTHGVSPSRLKIVGRGLEDPVASNRTEDGRQANRRVVITCTMH
ncbi:OmpA family protein [Streptomyces sp. NBC_01763]|uniref:OmpA family protein n=1 Tax=Streptomyces sp. NBC_01763 TaxID=2975934 RepID=UPI002DDA1447|nr:OmpA family protein [Streptomyces sp. NBC_01763]WSC34122.1 OmpA family protein [Streptomyces sp. NBC_01763]WSC41936.1 OmpA family protein [Streptomyces sp. NBC_01763]